MARVSPTKPSGSSRVRFIMLDADLANGDLTQITQAIQNALRPPLASHQRFVTSVPPAAPASAAANGGSEHVEAIEPDTTIDDGSMNEEATEASAQVTKPRKFRTPKVLEIDLETEPSFKSFADEKNPSSDLKRFLVVAAWFKVHRKIDAITADHAYTCFRAIKWPTAIPDFAQPLRELKRQQLLNAAGKGQFAINHLGLAKVAE